MCLGEENRELFPKVKFFICPLSYTIITFFHTDNRQPSWTRWPCWLRPGNTTVFSCQAAAASSCSCVSSASDLHLRVTSPRHCFSIRSTDKYLRKWRRPHVLVIPTPGSVSRTPPPLLVIRLIKSPVLHLSTASCVILCGFVLFPFAIEKRWQRCFLFYCYFKTEAPNHQT